MMQIHECKQGFYSGIKESVSVSLAGGLFGAAFGILAVMHGFSKGQIILMSAGIYAGAAQVIALKIMSQSDFPLLGLILTIMTLTLRYSLMSFSIRAYFKELNPKSIGIALFMLMDENWALCSIKARSPYPSSFLYGYFVGSGLSAYVSYVICTVLGLSIALLIHQPMSTQINFVFIALFVGLLAGSWRGKQEILPCLLSFALAIFFEKVLPGDWYIVSAALLASSLGTLHELYRQS